MFGLMPRKNNNVVTQFFDDDFFNNDFLGDSFFGRGLMNFSQAMHNQFKIDVKENDNAYTIEADLPGVSKEEIGLDYDNGTLFIAVNHNEETNGDQDGYIHRERRSMSMQRGIYVGDIDVNAIDAKLENGVLHITAPKLAIPGNQYRIEIH